MENKLEMALEAMGMHDKKARIYIALLELGEASVIDIAKKTGLKRTTIYNILPEMIQEGLVQSGGKKRKHIFFIENPRSLKAGFEDKAKFVDKLLPQLQAIHNVIPYKPKITFYEGRGGLRDLYQDTLDSLSPGDEILSYQGFRDFYTYMPKDFMDDYVARRAAKKIRIKMIVPDSPVAHEVKAEGPRVLREVKIVTDPEFNFNADTEIYANKVALIAPAENFLGVIIESKEINAMQRLAFNLLWKSLK